MSISDIVGYKIITKIDDIIIHGKCVGYFINNILYEKKIVAIMLLRKKYGCSVNECRKYLDGLSEITLTKYTEYLRKENMNHD